MYYVGIMQAWINDTLTPGEGGGKYLVSPCQRSILRLEKMFIHIILHFSNLNFNYVTIL